MRRDTSLSGKGCRERRKEERNGRRGKGGVKGSV